MEKSLYVNSPLGTKVSVDQICRDYELEILGILLMVDLRVMDISDFDVILSMDWLTAHRVAIDCDSCDAPNSGGPINHRQPAETYVSHIMKAIHE